MDIEQDLVVLEVLEPGTINDRWSQAARNVAAAYRKKCEECEKLKRLATDTGWRIALEQVANPTASPCERCGLSYVCGCEE